MSVINGIDTVTLKAFADVVSSDATKGVVEFGVTTRWSGGTKMESHASYFKMAGESHRRNFFIVADEPEQLLGTNTAPNPQELLMSAMNSCMMVGYIANAALMGIKIEKLEIETKGELDLRGFLGLSDNVIPGNKEIQYIIRVKSSASEKDLQELHAIVVRTSPNRWNIANAVPLTSKLFIE